MIEPAYRQAIQDAMSGQEVADRLEVTTSRVRQLTRLGGLPLARKIGRDVVYWPADVEVLRQRETRPGPKVRSK